MTFGQEQARNLLLHADSMGKKAHSMERTNVGSQFSGGFAKYEGINGLIAIVRTLVVGVAMKYLVMAFTAAVGAEVLRQSKI